MPEGAGPTRPLEGENDYAEAIVFSLTLRYTGIVAITAVFLVLLHAVRESKSLSSVLPQPAGIDCSANTVHNGRFTLFV